MKILSSSDLVADLRNSNLFLDTNAVVGAFYYGDLLGSLIRELREEGCAMITIPSVVFEFTRGTTTVEGFNKRLNFIEILTGKNIYPIERFLNNFEELTIVLQRLSGKMSYTDFLLCACLKKFPNSYLITENHQDFPLNVLDRKHLVTIDTDKELRNYAMYSFSNEKYNIVASKISKNLIKPPVLEEVPF